MSKLRLWGHQKSINVQKVLWALDELGLQYERVEVGGAFGRVRDADYLSLNPNGLIPTLEDDGTPLWESNAILRYLAGRYGQAPFYPSDPRQRARADGWVEWYSSTFWLNVRPIVVQLLRTPEAQRDPALLETSLRNASAAALILDRELSTKPYVAGDQFSFGDLPLAAAAQRWFNLNIERPETKFVAGWYARVAERPAFKRWIDLPLW
jgi:glutathione S-transferase